MSEMLAVGLKGAIAPEETQKEARGGLLASHHCPCAGKFQDEFEGWMGKVIGNRQGTCHRRVRAKAGLEADRHCFSVFARNNFEVRIEWIEWRAINLHDSDIVARLACLDSHKALVPVKACVFLQEA